MGFSKELFMQVRESEESYYSSLNRSLDEYWGSNSHQSVIEDEEESHTSQEEKEPDFFEIGYPDSLGHWVLVKTCFTESEADTQFKKLRRENADYRNYKKILHIKRCYVKAEA